MRSGQRKGAGSLQHIYNPQRLIGRLHPITGGRAPVQAEPPGGAPGARACVCVCVCVCARVRVRVLLMLLYTVHDVDLQSVHIRGLVVALRTAEVWQLLGAGGPLVPRRYRALVPERGGRGGRVERCRGSTRPASPPL